MTFTLTIKTPADLAAEADVARKSQIDASVEAHIEAQARALGYSSAAQLASYVVSTVPAWAAEAQAFVAWRDACWQAVFALPADATTDAALAALPQL